MQMRAQNDILKQIDDLVEKNGWAVLGVMADPENMVPSYSYTVGLSARGMADLIVIGLDPRNAQVILNTAVDRIMETKADLAAGSLLTEVASVPLRAKPLRPDQFGPVALSAVRHAGQTHAKVTVVQLEFPDTNGNFPGESACSPQMARLQDVDLLCAKQASTGLEAPAAKRSPRKKPH